MKIAIIIHAFYPQLWPEVANCVRSFAKYDYDLFVTLPENATGEFERSIRQDFPKADIKRLPNRGFDVGPFVEVLHRIDLSQYDFIVKLHTKRNRFGVVNFIPLFGGQWRGKLLAFCRSPKNVRRCFEIFTARPKVGMIGNGELIVRPWDEMVRTPPPKSDTDHRAFVGGTMFMVRASLLKPVCERIHFEDFEVTSRNLTVSHAHEWERQLGYLMAELGYEVSSYPKKGILYHLLNPILNATYRALFR